MAKKSPEVASYVQDQQYSRTWGTEAAQALSEDHRAAVEARIAANDLGGREIPHEGKVLPGAARVADHGPPPAAGPRERDQEIWRAARGIAYGDVSCVVS